MMRITPRHNNTPQAPASPPAHPGNAFVLSEGMEDTTVHRLWVTEQVHREITQWVNASLLRDPIPEVGGMLGGTFEKGPAGLETYLTDFLPARQVNFESPVRIDFGSQIMMDWDAYRQEKPGLQLVGWFHTHPGLTPYLSWVDLYTHKGFFRQPHQVAVVLDPLTDEWDTGCFSWQAVGEVNNKTDLKNYFSWNSIFTE